MEPTSRVEKDGKATAKWVVIPPMRPSTPRVRVFCFPFAGGGASVYRTWANQLPAGVQLISIQLPGRETRLLERPIADISALVAEIAPVIQGYGDQPFAFFGHSMGALISLELARWLQRQALAGPQHLFVSGHRAPQLPGKKRPIHQLPDEEFIRSVGEFNGTPKDVLLNRELLDLLLPTLRADFTLVETYRHAPAPPLDCPITAMGGLNDDEACREELLAWREHTSSGFRVVMFPGDHFFIRTAEALVLRALSYDLSPLL